MPHPIVEIDELVRPIIDYLVEISPQSTVSFALACQSLEEPALSSLWKQQSSLITLLHVLPQFNRVGVLDGNCFVSRFDEFLGYVQYRLS